MSATNTVAVPTSWATSIFNSFESINWGEIATAVEQKSLGGAITTAEHVAEAVAGAIAKTGNPIAMTVESVIPAAESLVGVVMNLVSAFHAASSPAAPAPAPAPIQDSGGSTGVGSSGGGGSGNG